jgi:hypothetical protein
MYLAVAGQQPTKAALEVLYDVAPKVGLFAAFGEFDLDSFWTYHFRLK